MITDIPRLGDKIIEDEAAATEFHLFLETLVREINDLIAVSGSTYLYKATDETKNNDTTVAADTDLQLSLDANSFYSITGAVLFEAHATPDFAYNFLEADGTYEMTLFKGDATTPTTGVEGIDETFAGNSVAMNGIGTTHWVHFIGAIQTGVTGGIFSFAWSQNTSSVEDTTLMAGSWMHLNKL